MKKSTTSLGLIALMVSLPAMAGNMRSSSTTNTDSMGTSRETATTQERMEDGSMRTKKSTNYRDREPSDTGSSVRKSKSTTRKIDEEESDIND